MKISIIGTGYVGLVTGACLAEMGNDVVCVDVDDDKVRLLESGVMPIHEEGLEEVARRNAAAGRLRYSTDMAQAVAHGTLLFIAVGTQPGEDGAADLRSVLAAASDIGRLMTDYKVVVAKSTVPVGTGHQLHALIGEQLQRRGVRVDYSVVSNPEFLKEGVAVADFMRPDRVVIGAEDERAVLLMRTLYAPFVHNRDRVLVMDLRSAEFTKYAANAMLATRISFMNELSRVAERVGADIEQVRQGIGADPRIGSHFLYAGIGYGGSCLPKDLAALLHSSLEAGQPLQLLSAVQAVNEQQKHVLVDKVVQRLGAVLSGRTLALWGLAFKPKTDDMRDAPSLTLVRELARRGARVCAYDPVAAIPAQRLLRDVAGFALASSAQEALQGADALLIATEWKEFRTPDFDAMRAAMKTPLVFDGRNLYEPALMARHGFEYRSIGRPAALPDIP